MQIRRMTVTKEALDALREEGVVVGVRELPCPEHVDTQCGHCGGHGTMYEIQEYPLSLEDA